MGVYRSHYTAPEGGDDDVPRRGRHAAPDDGDDYGDSYGDGYGGADYSDRASYPSRSATTYGATASVPASVRADPDLDLPAAATTGSRRTGTVYGRRRAAEPWDDDPAEVDVAPPRAAGRHADAGEEPSPRHAGRHTDDEPLVRGRSRRRASHAAEDYSDHPADDHHVDGHHADGYIGRRARRRAAQHADDDDDYPKPYGRAAAPSRRSHAYGDAYDDYDDYDDEYDDDYAGDRYHDRRLRREADHYSEADDYDDYDDEFDDDGRYRGRYRDDEPGYNRGRRRAHHVERDRKPPDTGDRIRAGIRGFGELLITFGLVVLLFAGYEVWGKSAQVDAAQNELDEKLEDRWGGKTPKEKPLPGDAIARLHIPRLEKHWVVVEGVKPKDIKNAPGHYPDSAMPGQKGNFATAGHRMPAVFWNLHKMQKKDPIFLEDANYWYEYRVTEVKIVLPNQVEVVAPVPGKPGAKPKEAFLTITTCNPQWDNYERLIVHAKLAKKQDKDEGRPPALAD